VRRALLGAWGTLDVELLARAGLPADPDPQLLGARLGDQRDVGDQRAQHPLAVAVGGGGRGPEAGQVGAQRLELGRWRQRRDGGRGLRERLLGLGERGEACFPALLEAAATSRCSGSQA
jgi:hypothetical protein